jgi:sulfate transport system ATP-binding protein
MIDRIVHLGFEVRVELLPAEGPPMWAQLTREQAQLLELDERQIVYVRPSRKKVFDENGPRTEELVAV